MARRDLSGRSLQLLAGLGAAAVGGYFALVKPFMTTAWHTPGSRELYLAGVVGLALLLVPSAFSLTKRTGVGGAPPTWFSAHVVCGVLGTGLIAVHSAGHFDRPPALLFLLLVAVVCLGFWIRLHRNAPLAANFASRRASFSLVDPARRRLFASVIHEKEVVLSRLDPGAREATFSVRLVHWIRHPLLSWQYARLARQERVLMGTTGGLGPALTRLRRLHMALAIVFFLGVLVHVIIVTFFADHAAGGKPVTWWHVAR